MSWEALIGAGLSAYSAYSASKGQEKANQANFDFAREQMQWSAQEAAKNREWQEYMSSTSHQREVKDLRAAGLNPILSASRGAPMGSAAMPSAHSATAENTKKYDPELAIATAKLANEARLTSAMVEKAKSEKRVIDAEGDIKSQERDFWTSTGGKWLMGIKNTFGALSGPFGAFSALRFAQALKGLKGGQAAIKFATRGRR